MRHALIGKRGPNAPPRTIHYENNMRPHMRAHLPIPHETLQNKIALIFDRVPQQIFTQALLSTQTVK